MEGDLPAGSAYGKACLLVGQGAALGRDISRRLIKKWPRQKRHFLLASEPLSSAVSSLTFLISLLLIESRIILDPDL